MRTKQKPKEQNQLQEKRCELQSLLLKLPEAFLKCACYYGESAKNMHCRSKEHVAKFNSKSEKIRAESAFYKHLVNSHGGKAADKNFADYFEVQILENILLKTMYDLPSQENIEEVIVDASAAKGLTQPILVHSKIEGKSKTSKTSAA